VTAAVHTLSLPQLFYRASNAAISCDLELSLGVFIYVLRWAPQAKMLRASRKQNYVINYTTILNSFPRVKDQTRRNEILEITFSALVFKSIQLNQTLHLISAIIKPP